MKYIQAVLLFIIGMFIYILNIIISFPILWFLGSEKPLNIIKEIETSVLNGFNNLLK